MSKNNNWFIDYLACPDCKSNLLIEANLHCDKCLYSRGIGCKDLKPINPTPLTIPLGRVLEESPHDVLNNTNTTKPNITYAGPVAMRDSRELMSVMQMFLTQGANVLDLGCGPRDQKIPIDYLGYKYVGIDYSNQKADILADAHAIPFKDSTFDCVLSYAVLEHLHNPIIAAHEIERVLKPNGIYVGTVSLGEPFHDSYFHHSAWGFISLISIIPNLQVIRLWPSNDTLYSLATMGRYPRIIRKLITIIDFFHRYLPILAPRKMRWSEKEKTIDQIHRAGSICFVVKKTPNLHSIKN